MKRFRLALINTGAANIHSVEKAIRKIGGDPVVTTSADVISSAHAAVLPGVGANDAVMKYLTRNKLPDVIKEFATSGRPLLCVCLGMQVLFDRSEEGVLPGLSILEGDVVKLLDDMTDDVGGRLKVPHMGWNRVHFRDSHVERHPVFAEVGQGTHFYFVHSYHCVPEMSSDIAATARHGVEITAAVVRDNVIGTQFHPEKSGRVGVDIYASFLKYASELSRNMYSVS